MENISAAEYVAGLVERARKAQKIAETYTQERVDELSRAVAWAGVNPKSAVELATLAYEETHMGDYDSKLAKLNKKVKGMLREINGQKSVGVIETDEKKGIRKIAKPVGVIAALIPATQPEMTPFVKGICAIKARNAVIFSAHPSSLKTTTRAVELMREALKKYGAPEDLFICDEKPSREMSAEIMKQCDLVIATGGANMVVRAYSSGTPAYGVGVGNANVVIDETADLKDAATKIRISKTFDLSAGCSCENSIIVKDTIYDEFIKCLKAEGGYMTNAEEKAKLQAAMWPDGKTLSRYIVARPAAEIAKQADINIPEGTRFLMVEETGAGKGHIFSGEKLSVVLAVYKYNKFEEAINIINLNQATAAQGAGHSCGIHSFNEDHIMQLALGTKTTRVMIRQPQSAANSGDWENGMPWTVTLGCGTWGGNIASENIGLKHFMNTSWVAAPIARSVPTDEELFGDIMNK